MKQAGDATLRLLVDTNVWIDYFIDRSRSHAAAVSLVSEAQAADVDLFSSIETTKKCLDLAEQYKFIYASVGVHPSDIADLNEDTFGWLREQTKKPKVVAIGEIGLDYYWPKREYEAAVKVKGDAIGWQALKNYKNGVPKLLVITDNLEQTNERVGILNTEFADKVDAFSSNPNYIEITAKGVSKAAAIDILAGKLKISKLETLAIGDSYNDLPMLKAAGVSVAMGNAPDNIKKVCTYVTESCEADGFAKFIIQNFEFLTK